MHVASVWQYPVKSMVGTTVPVVELNHDGMVGDRMWAARDHVRGGIRGAKKIGALMHLAAQYVDGHDGPVEIHLPDGSVTRTDRSDVHERVSAAIEHPVTLEALRPADDLDHYRRGAPDTDDVMAELRGIFGRDGDEPLPDFSVFPPVIMEYESPPGTYLDAFPLMLMTTSALRSLAQALPDSVVDVRRFRPSFVIDTGDAEGHPEQGWVGRRARLGTAELQIAAACPRCVMITRAIAPDIPEDRAVLRHVVRELDQCVGVYATVVTPGTVHAGDELELL